MLLRKPPCRKPEYRDTLCLVLWDLATPRTGASEAVGGHTPMEQLLSEAFAEFGFEEPAEVPGSVYVGRCPKETVKEETVKMETIEEETAEEETAEVEPAEEEIDWNSEARPRERCRRCCGAAEDVTHAAACTGQLRLRHQ